MFVLLAGKQRPREAAEKRPPELTATCAFTLGLPAPLLSRLASTRVAPAPPILPASVLALCPSLSHLPIASLSSLTATLRLLKWPLFHRHAS